ncbi:MAG: ABC transporter permease subunit, partial [Candidatus Hydrogenedentota bacterium]
MIWWKEWRETRFGFLVTIFFLTGLYMSMPFGQGLENLYWSGVSRVLAGLAVAIVFGSTAVTPEIVSGTMEFLTSRPTGRSRLLATKYIVRGAEVAAVFAVPTLFQNLIHAQDRPVWMWVPPYLGLQYSLLAVLAIILLYSGTFFFSVLFRRQWFCVLGGMGLLAAYLSFRGWFLFGQVYRLQ